MTTESSEHYIDDPVISIGTLAEKVCLSVSAVRKYENEGLIIPYRTKTGRRLFSQEDIDRVRYIQHMIQDLRLNIEGIRRMQSLLPCWNLLPCSVKSRNKCDAFKNNARPCWSIKSLACAPQGNECRKCVVYRFGSLCTEHIKRLLHDQIKLNDTGPAIKELLLRKQR